MGKYVGKEFDRWFASLTPRQQQRFIFSILALAAFTFMAVLLLH